MHVLKIMGVARKLFNYVNFDISVCNILQYCTVKNIEFQLNTDIPPSPTLHVYIICRNRIIAHISSHFVQEANELHVGIRKTGNILPRYL